MANIFDSESPYVINQNVGFGGQQTPTASIHIGPSNGKSNTAPLKLTPGISLTNPENGAIEFDGTHLYMTIGGVRSQLDNQTGSGGLLTLDSLTTTQRNALTPVNGMLINNSSVNQFQKYENSQWIDISKSPATKVVAPAGSGYSADYYTTGTNDDVQIQAALAAVSSLGGGKVFLASGIYFISSNILFDNLSKIFLQGEGKENTIIQCNSNSVTDMLHFTTSSFIGVSDISINANQANFTNAKCMRVYSNVTDCRFFNVRFHDGIGYNIQINNNTNARILFEDCDIQNAGFGGVLSQDTIQVDFKNCNFSGNTVIDIYFNYVSGGGKNNTAIGNHSTSSTTSWHFRGQLDGTIFSNNTIENNANPSGSGGGISIERTGIIANNRCLNIQGDDSIAVSTTTAHNVVVSNNYCDTNTGYNGIFIGDGAVAVSCTNNTITNCDIGGIRIWGAQYSSFIGNTLYNNCVNTGGNTNYDEIWMGHSTFGSGFDAIHNTISDNTIFTTNGRYGIQPNGMTPNTIEGNDITGATVGFVNGSHISSNRTTLDVFSGSSGFTGSLNTRTAGVIEGGNGGGTTLSILAAGTYSGIFFGNASSETNGLLAYIHSTQSFQFNFGGGSPVLFTTGNKLRIGNGTTPTAILHLTAGTASANSSPLKFTSGTNLTTPEAGAMEFDGTHLYITIGSTRFTLDQQAGTTYSAGTGLSLAGTTFSLSTPVSILNGGTGQTTYTDGQLLIGDSSTNGLDKATLTGTTNQISVTNGNGSIILATPQNIHTGATPTFAGLSLTGAQTITSTSANALAVGPNGATTPGLHVDGSAATAITGIKITMGGTGVAPILSSDSSDTNIALVVTTKGNGQIQLHPGGDSTTAITFANAAGALKMRFDTSNARMRLGDNGAPTGTLDILGKFIVNSSGLVTQYNNVATAGNGVPSVYGYGRSTAQTGAVASVAAYTVGAADGSFMVSANVLVTTSTTHSFSVQMTYTDESNTSRTVTFNVQQLGGTLVTAITNVTGASAYEGIPLHIRAKAATAITILTSGTFTSVTYNVEGAITQIA
jgi:hypothetical protein